MIGHDLFGKPVFHPGSVSGAGFLRIMPQRAPKRETFMAYTFVLVHGAWHGGWCWQRVADRLRGGGHKVFTPTLTGLGERSHLLRSDIDMAPTSPMSSMS